MLSLATMPTFRRWTRTFAVAIASPPSSTCCPTAMPKSLPRPHRLARPAMPRPHRPTPPAPPFPALPALPYVDATHLALPHRPALLAPPCAARTALRCSHHPALPAPPCPARTALPPVSFDTAFAIFFSRVPSTISSGGSCECTSGRSGLAH
eukprot:SAG11_NODE_48_length_20030_cov_232.459084_7_plen_152_part_00